jgi:hypothetical protein
MNDDAPPLALRDEQQDGVIPLREAVDEVEKIAAEIREGLRRACAPGEQKPFEMDFDLLERLERMQADVRAIG